MLRACRCTADGLRCVCLLCKAYTSCATHPPSCHIPRLLHCTLPELPPGYSVTSVGATGATGGSGERQVRACDEGYYRDGWVAAANLPAAGLLCKACANNMGDWQAQSGMRSVNSDAIATYSISGTYSETLVKGSPNACGACKAEAQVASSRCSYRALYGQACVWVALTCSMAL